MAEVQLTADAANDFQKLPTAMKSRVRDVVTRLREWPNVSGAKPLQHDLKGAYRIRTGDYRVVFTAKGNVVTVIRIDNRRDVYR